MARPPLALDRLELREDGQVVYRFKKAWKNGTHAVVLSPQDFIAPSRAERAEHVCARSCPHRGFT